MIFHEDCALNIEHVLFKGSDAIVIGWVKGDAGLSLVSGNTTFSGQLIRSERPDVAEYFGIKNTECFGFALYSSDVKAASRASLSIRLLDKRSSTWTDVLLTESADYADGLNVVSSLKTKGLPEDFFQEGIFLDGVKFKLGGQADRRTAVGYVEVAKAAKEGKGLLLIGWAVSKSPNNFVIKVGDAFYPYDTFFAYPRPDIEEAFSKTFGQNARKSGFITFVPEPDLKSGQIQLYYCKRSTRTLLLVASTDKIEKDIAFEDLQGYLQGIHTPELSLTDRVRQVDGPLAVTALRHTEESAYYIRPEILIRPLNTDPELVLNIVVPKGLSGDVLQGVMALVTLRIPGQSMAVNYYFSDVVTDGGLLLEIAKRTHSLFGCQVAVHHGCTNLVLGHLGYGMGKHPAARCIIVDARSGFEFAKISGTQPFEAFDAKEVRVFYARDVNGVSGATFSVDELSRFIPDDDGKAPIERMPYSRNKVFGMALLGKTLSAMCTDMGFVPLRELTDLEFLIWRTENLSERFRVVREQNGLPFARTQAPNQQFQASLGRQIELYTMAQVGA
ncbi:MAG: hypothetical protein ACK4FF_10680 [Limnobacter sp.]|uniref:hypothetical protein n=1 Tax=Limnobacter sp. TaxID=2003368 RepID=UPI00391A7DB8